MPHTLLGARDRAENKTGKDSCPHREDKCERETKCVICYINTLEKNKVGIVIIWEWGVLQFKIGWSG